MGAKYGIHFVFDQTVPTAASPPVRFVVDNADFREAMRVLTAITGTMVAPLETQQAIVAEDSVQNHARYERVVLRELSVEGLSTPEEINEVAQTLRTVLELRFVQPDQKRKVITIRDTVPRVAAAGRIVASLVAARPQVVVELQTLEVSKDWSRDLGISMNFQRLGLQTFSGEGPGSERGCRAAASVVRDGSAGCGSGGRAGVSHFWRRPIAFRHNAAWRYAAGHAEQLVNP